MKMAEVLLVDSNKKLDQVASAKGKVDKAELLKVQAVLRAGVARFSETKSKIEHLNKEKSILCKKK